MIVVIQVNDDEDIFFHTHNLFPQGSKTEEEEGCGLGRMEGRGWQSPS